MSILSACIVLIATAAGGIDAAASQADAAYRAKDWERAVALYRNVVKLQPDSSLSWVRLGECLHRIGQDKAALSTLEQAQKAGAPAGSVQYQLARVRASMGEPGRAFDALAEAVRQGRGRPDLLLAEADFRGLRSDPRFDPLVDVARHNQDPCRFRGENRQFDFWIGDWNVVSTQDRTPVGSSHIEKTIGDCVIWESWTSHGDSQYSGKSYNTYNVEQARWEQFWVDNQGGMIHFHGKLIDGVMDFHTDTVAQADGKSLQRRLRFYAVGPDTVRQWSQGSSDDGLTWTTEYDFTYRRSN